MFHSLDIILGTQRICCAQYDVPPALQLSAECVDLLSRILVAAPAQRIGVAGICAHPWFLRNLPGDLQVSYPGSKIMTQGHNVLCQHVQLNSTPAWGLQMTW